MSFEEINEGNYATVASIYEAGLATGIASFETESPSWGQWDANHHTFGRLLLKVEEEFVAWVALSPTSKRWAYRGVAELSLYVSPDFAGKGYGSLVMKKIIETCEQNDIWTIHAGIFKENLVSRSLHIKHGFREIGYRERVAQRNGIWHDNYIYERRSKTIGS